MAFQTLCKPCRPRPVLWLCLWLLSSCGQEDKHRTVEFWAFGGEGEIARELASEFEQENPGVRVRVQQIPWSAAHEKLLTAYAGNNLPDVFQLGNSWIAEFSALRALEDMSTRFEKLGRGGDFFPATLDAAVIDSKLRAVPWYVDTRLLFYRRDLLERAGVPQPPQTWDGWVEALRRLRDAGRGGAAFLPVNEWQVPVILALQRGAGMLKEDGRYGDFLHPDFKAAFEFYLRLFWENLAPAASAGQIANFYLEFGRGAFAVSATGPWNLGEFRRRLPGLPPSAWDTAPMPSFDGSYPGLSLAGGASLAIAAGSQRKDAAWKLVEFLTAPRQQLRLYRLSGDLPPGQTAWNDPALTEDGKAQAFRRQMERLTAPPKIPEWERIASRIAVYAEKSVRGEQTVTAALEALNREVDEILEKRRWLLEHGR